jgi:hypothetical protein
MLIPSEISNLLVEDVIKPFVLLRDRLNEVEREIRRIEISIDNGLARVIDLIRESEEKRTKMLHSFRKENG